MATQYDFNPGFDLSSVTNPTRTQHIQAISQIAPLNNIGGVIWQAGTSAAASIAQGTGGSPDVTNNPRFTRYIWLNTFTSPSTRYVYVAPNWVISSVAAGSISNAEISATAEIAVSKLADGAANEIISTNADGVTVNWTSVASLLAALNDSVPLTAIDDTAAVGATSFLRRDGSTVVWKTFAETVTAIQAALSGVSPSIFTPGANNTLLGTNGAGTVAFNTPANILANNSITLPLLHGGGATTGDTLKFDGSNWIKVTPSLDLVGGVPINGGTLGAVNLSSATLFETFAHGLGTTPRLVHVVVRCTALDAASGYDAGDEIDLGAWICITGDDSPLLGYMSDVNNIYVFRKNNTAADIKVMSQGGTAHAVVTSLANFTPKVYAWK